MNAEIQKRKRINVALWAYAYEIKDDPMVSDAMFDKVCTEIDLAIATDSIELDAWFFLHFDPCTGQWVHSHPELDKLAALYDRLTSHKVKVQTDPCDGLL